MAAIGKIFLILGGRARLVRNYPGQYERWLQLCQARDLSNFIEAIIQSAAVRNLMLCKDGYVRRLRDIDPNWRKGAPYKKLLQR